MKQRIIKIIRKILKDILRELLLEIIQNRLVLLREVYKKNRDSYDKVADLLMNAKIQALEELYIVVASSLDG